MILANTCIDSALLGMRRWIGKGNWPNAVTATFLGFRECMQRYYLRLTGQAIRQVQVNKSFVHIRTVDNALRVYVKEARRANSTIHSILRPPDRHIQNVEDCDMIAVNDYMPDMSGMQTHMYILQIQQDLSDPIFLYNSTWGASGHALPARDLAYPS